MVNRLDVYLVNLDPTIGREIRKRRPCMIVSPDAMNHHSEMVVIAPLTSKPRSFPTRVECVFKGKRGQIALDQIRAVDTTRLLKKLGVMDRATGLEAMLVLSEMFAP